jgi:hypothetical protein
MPHADNTIADAVATAAVAMGPVRLVILRTYPTGRSGRFIGGRSHRHPRLAPWA